MKNRVVKWVLYVISAYFLIQWIHVSAILGKEVAIRWVGIIVCVVLIGLGAFAYYHCLSWIKKMTTHKKNSP